MGSSLAAITALAGLFAGPSGDEPFVRTCETRAEGPELRYEARPAHDVILGRVRFVGLRDRVPLSRLPNGDATRKAAVVVEWGAPVTVRIRPLRRTRARLDYDTEARRRVGQLAVRFEPCPPDTPRFTDGRPIGEQTAYPGGFLVARRGCARLIARAPGEDTMRRRVALGVAPRRCD